MNKWSLVVAANNEAVLSGNLLRSPEIGEARALIVQEGYISAGTAYNDGIERAESDIVVFAHQDVYLPPGWTKNFQQGLNWLNENDPTWAVAGAYGTSRSNPGMGLVYCNANQRILGQVTGRPQPVDTFDELLLVIRKSSGLRFDSKLPGFHLYGTDICMQARSQAFSCYAFEAFCIHNSTKTGMLPWAFWQAYFYIRKKWRNYLPIATPCVSITRSNWNVVANCCSGLKSRYSPRRKVFGRVADPHALAIKVESCFPQRSAGPISALAN